MNDERTAHHLTGFCHATKDALAAQKHKYTEFQIYPSHGWSSESGMKREVAAYEEIIRIKHKPWRTEEKRKKNKTVEFWNNEK